MRTRRAYALQGTYGDDYDREQEASAYMCLGFLFSSKTQPDYVHCIMNAQYPH